jgi:hypothetical protein
MPSYTREPGVASREQVVGYMGTSVPNENLDLLTYCQIVAETGPTDAVVISGLPQLLNTFTYKKALSPAMPKCFLEAAFMASYCPLLVKRVAPSIGAEPAKIEVVDSAGDVVFEIVHQYANSDHLMRIGIELIDNTKFILSLENIIYDSTDPDNSTVQFTETYTVSTDLDSTNEVGLSNSVDIINDYREDIKIKLVKPLGEIVQMNYGTEAAIALEVGKKRTIYFGKSTNEKVAKWYKGEDPENLNAAWTEAINELPEEEVDIPAFVMSTTVPGNPTAYQLTYDKNCQQAARDIKAWPIMNPYVEDYSYENVRQLGPAYGSGSSYGKLCLPGFYDTSVLGRKLLLGGGFDYHRTIVANYYAGKAYAPIMGTDGNGTAACGNTLAVKYKKSERLELLNNGITPIKWHRKKRFAYFLMNNSLNTTDDSISEEQNRRLMNKVSHDMDNILDQMVGKYNIEETRDRVEEAVSNYQRFTLKQMSYGVAELQVKCNIENNTAPIINANRLEVEIGIRFNRAIRWVNILYKILPVASE